MPNIWYFVILGILVTIFVFFRYRAKPRAKYPFVAAKPNDLEDEFLKLWNGYRKSLNLGTLRVDKLASKLEFEHCSTMVSEQQAGHSNLDARRSELVLLGALEPVEVSAQEYTSISGMFRGYLKSADHAPKLLNQRLNCCGISIIKDPDGKLYSAIMIFKV